MPPRLVAIVPCNDINRSAAFYARLGFTCVSDYGDYRIYEGPGGSMLHLRQAEPGWLKPLQNPFGVYLYAEDVDGLAARVSELLIHPPEDKPWGMYEFALSDPDHTLVRVGRRSQARP